MIRAMHLRMARAALGWTLRELADRAGVHINTISRYEAGAEIMSGTMEKLEEVLRAEGVVLLDEDADYFPAIRIRKDVPFPGALASARNPFSGEGRISKTKPKGAKKPKR